MVATFEVLEISIELVGHLRGIVRSLEQRDRDLASQIRRAASSIALNLGESRGRQGKDRVHYFRIARGSAEEVHAALRVAMAWGDLDQAAAGAAFAALRSVIAITRALSR